MRVGKIAAWAIAIALVSCVARNAQAQTADPERAKQDLRDAKAVSKRHAAELMKIPHVTVVTGEIDAQSDAAILVEVDDQNNADAVTRQLPSQIEGFPVEVDDRDDGSFHQDISNGFFVHGEPARDPDAQR
jgi:hypothetical protein